MSFKVGDLVYRRMVRGSYARDIQRVQTIERSTHNGQRFVTSEGHVFLARNGQEVGDHGSHVFKLYTPEVQAEWDALNRWEQVERRLYRCHVDAQKYRYYPIDAAEEIAAVCEKHIDAYKRALDERNTQARAEIAARQGA